MWIGSRARWAALLWALVAAAPGPTLPLRPGLGLRLLESSTAGEEPEPGAAPLTPGLPVFEHCTDTCSMARNGICEEGRRMPSADFNNSLPRMTYCDLGSDCADCGLWKTTAPQVPWMDVKTPGAIRFLRAKEVQVRVKPAVVPPDVSFLYAYTDPSKDYDVSWHMEHAGMVEPLLSKIFYRILKDRCLRPDGSRALVVDVGANFGWFAILAARLGCRVIAYEPVPLFRHMLLYNIHVNDLTSRIEVRDRAVTDKPGLVKMVVPYSGIWGTAGIDGLNIDHAIEGKKEDVHVQGVRLEDEVKEDVLLMKVDVEGWEPGVMAGAAGLLRGQRVEHIVMEYTPGAPERWYNFEAMEATPRMLVDLIHLYGYRVGSVGDGKTGFGDWDAPLPPAREVTLDNLKYDVADVRLWKDGKLGCPYDDMLDFKAWAGCFGVPESLNARSLRAELTHNVNLWITKPAHVGPNGMELEARPVGLIPPDAPPNTYWVNNTYNFGMGGRPCDGMDAEWQVRHHCKCSVPECAAEEAALERLLAEGRVPPQAYVLGDAVTELGLA